MSERETLFHARPGWQRWLFRWWRLNVKVRLPGNDRHGIPHDSYRYIVPPREWSQETADAAIKLGQEKAEKYGW